MKKGVLFLLCYMLTLTVPAQQVKLLSDHTGTRLQVNGNDFMIYGVNWDYFPVGTNYDYNIWAQPDETIRAALHAEMSLLKQMGANAIRVYTGIPPKWITYIYKNYGIYTLVNHSFGRYGLTLNGQWKADTHYDDPDTQKLLLEEVKKMAQYYKGTQGLLMYMLGNENNYGLFWQGAETEDFPTEDAKLKAVGEQRARPMYRLMNAASKIIKATDSSVPVALCNGDLLFLEIIAEECPDIDIYGTNMYRGFSFGDAFEKVKNLYGKPIMFTEFGSDAFDALKLKENGAAQAQYLLTNWKEIYHNAAGLNNADNSLGGFTFQFSDGWWKFGQTYNLDKHDTHASWANGGYAFDFEKGKNNMNEEWFGICAKGPTEANGLYKLYPRAAYFVLKDVHGINPYQKNINQAFLDNFFAQISIDSALAQSKKFADSLSQNILQKNDGVNHYFKNSAVNPVWQDEFEGQVLDTAIWVFDIGRGNNGWGNAELQYYTQRNQNVKLKNGLLEITALQEHYKGAAYTSARIKTKGKFEKKYGRIEARIKLPKGQGIWPAFWMLGADISEVGWPKSGEIDIMEYRGQQPNIVLGTLHGPGYYGDDSISKNYESKTAGFNEGFHVYGVEWRENYIRFYVDDQYYQTLTPEDLPGKWVFDKPFFLLLNMAVGGNFVGNPSAETPFPQTLLVDYVRVYE